MNIREKLIQLLEGTGYTQKQVATKSKLSTAVVSQYLSGSYAGKVVRLSGVKNMAKVIFEFTDSEAESTHVPGRFSVPVCIAIDIQDFNGQRPGHAECLAMIMKKNAPAIIRAINETYVAKLKESGAGYVSSELIKVNLQ